MDRKVVLVTGASHGIGMGIALTMAEHGWDVAFSYRNNEEGARTVKKRIEDFGAAARFYQAEMGDPDSPAALEVQPVCGASSVPRFANASTP